RGQVARHSAEDISRVALASDKRRPSRVWARTDAGSGGQAAGWAAVAARPRGRTKTATRKLRRMRAAPTLRPAVKPELIAWEISWGVTGWWCRYTDSDRVVRPAMVTDAPICMLVFMRPEPRPLCDWGRSATEAAAVGTNSRPMPTARTII